MYACAGIFIILLNANAIDILIGSVVSDSIIVEVIYCVLLLPVALRVPKLASTWTSVLILLIVLYM